MAVPPYNITLVTDSQEEDPTTQNIVNTFEVNFNVPSLNYVSTVTVPKTGGDTVANIQTAVEAAIAQVQAIYALGTPPPPAP